MKSTCRFSLLIFICIIIILQLSSCSSPVIQKEISNTGIIDADNPNIQYIGRFDFSDPKKVVFDWPGVYICARFEGTGCSIKLQDSTDEYDVIIDHHAPKLLFMGTQEIKKIASGLTGSIAHTLTIIKRTEPFVGKGVFMGLVMDKGSRLLAPEKRTDKRIEYIGNSITCGYGVWGDSSGCHFSKQTEDASVSYAGIVSRELNSDYHLISYSGKGAVRNYGDSNKTSVNPMPFYYDRTCCYDSVLKWNFGRWIPQAVVINLGTNDFSTKPYPDKKEFENAYKNLIDRVRSLYPSVTIFCISGPMIGEPCTEYIREIVNKEQQREGRDKDVFFIEIPRKVMNDKDWGCDMHPNIFGAEKMADIIVRMIKLRMHW